MPPEDGAGGGAAPAVDVFGEPTPGSEQTPAGTGEAEKPAPSTDINELSRKLGEYEATVKNLDEKHREKDENIRAMRETIKRLEKQAKEGAGGTPSGDGTDAEALFKEVKTSKDLKPEERDDMTETEIKQFDEIAALKQGMNQLFKAVKEGKGKEDSGEAADTTEVARSYALEIAGKDSDIANQIIEQYNEFNNEGLTEAQVKARIEKAAKLVPDYKPPKEQTKKHGSPAHGGTDTDPFGTDKIISEVVKSREGNTYSL